MPHSRQSQTRTLCSWIALLTGCNSNTVANLESTEPAAAQRALVMIPKGTQATFWNAVRKGARQAESEFSVEVLWKGPALENDRAAQKQVLQRFITPDVDGILLAPTDRKSMAADVATAMARGIPVVIFDSAIEATPGSDCVAFVGTDNTAAGRLGGKHLIELVGNNAQVILFRHMEGHESTASREGGALDEFVAAGATVLEENRYSGETSSKAQMTALNMIDQIRAADGIFASNQTASEGLLLALRQSNLAGKIKFVGFDSSPLLISALQKGEIHALVLQDPVQMGYWSVSIMVDHLKGLPVAPVVNTEARLVTRANLHDAEVRPLWQ